MSTLTATANSPVPSLQCGEVTGQLAADPSRTGDTGREIGLARALLLVTLATWAGLLIVSGVAQITDPLVRHDDFPSLLLTPEAFYEKTLQEGRWINYWWHFRPFATPAWFNNQVCMLGWAIFAAALALHAVGSSALRYPVLLAALIVLSPQWTLISLWFNTLIPGIWLFAFYAVLTLWLKPFTSAALLLVFVPLTLLTYSTHPFMMLAVCLARQDQRRSFAGLVKLIVLFVISFALGLLLINTMNWYVHGVFGIQMAEWRNTSPAHDLAGLIANSSKVVGFLEWTYRAAGFDNARFAAVNGILFVGSLGFLARLRPLEALYIIAGILSGLGLLSLHALLEGVFIPFRATNFVWTFYAIALVRAAYLLGRGSQRTAQLALIAVATFAITTGGFVQKYYHGLGKWQEETRRIANLIPDDTKAIYIYGSYLGVPGALDAKIQHQRAYPYRLLYLTGINTISCRMTPAACAEVAPPFDPRPMPAETILTVEGSVAYIRLPAEDYAP